MRRLTALFTFVLVLGAVFYAMEASAEPVEITECSTVVVPGSYVLANNLSISNLPTGGSCLGITTDFVTIDLAGFSITGDGTGVGIQTFRDDQQGIVVRNGTIADFETGIVLAGGSSIIEGVRVLRNLAGILAANSISIVRNNIVQNNRGFGIAAMGTVSGNIAFGNAFGIVAPGPGSNVTGNLARNNSSEGIVASGTVTGNTSNENGTSGIRVFDQGSTVSGNTAARNGGTGILVVCPSNVIGNTATNNTGGNLVLDGAGCTNIDNLAP
jgi:hypothetical protein